MKSYRSSEFWKWCVTDMYLSKRPVGDTKIPLPIMVPTMSEIPLKRPTVRFSSNGASVSLKRKVDITNNNVKVDVINTNVQVELN